MKLFSLKYFVPFIPPAATINLMKINSVISINEISSNPLRVKGGGIRNYLLPGIYRNRIVTHTHCSIAYTKLMHVGTSEKLILVTFSLNGSTYRTSHIPFMKAKRIANNLSLNTSQYILVKSMYLSYLPTLFFFLLITCIQHRFLYFQVST